MTALVVHDTPGLIDVRSFTTFGVNAKPRVASPIGFFGTGLKYAVSVLVRAGAEVTVWIGEQPHVFFVQDMKFRDKSFHVVRMRRQRGVTARWMAEDLPFTTELGRHWEIWQALRELHSNTLDEGGESYALDDSLGDVMLPGAKVGSFGSPDRTRIVVRLPAYLEAFQRLGDVFLPEADRSLRTGVQLIERESGSLYYRGLRAMDLQKPSLFTWCVFDELQLTEDRTVKQPVYAQVHVQRYVMEKATAEQVRAVLRAPPTAWESDLVFEYMMGATASEQFREESRLWGRGSAARWLGARSVSFRETMDWRTAFLLSSENDEPEAFGKKCWEIKALLRSLVQADLDRTPPRATAPSAETDDGIPF